MAGGALRRELLVVNGVMYWTRPATGGSAILLLAACTMTNHQDVMVLADRWEFRQAGTTAWYPASVPGVVHLDLLSNGLIVDPFYRDNESRQQWIEHEDWEYRTTFVVPLRGSSWRRRRLPRNCTTS